MSVYALTGSARGIHVALLSDQVRGSDAENELFGLSCSGVCLVRSVELGDRVKVLRFLLSEKSSIRPTANVVKQVVRRVLIRQCHF